MTERPEKPDAELVDFEPRIMKVIYNFEVVGENNVDGEQCVLINVRIASINGVNALPRRHFQLLLRQSNLSLKKFQSLNSKTSDIVFSRSFEEGAIDVTDRVGFLPLVLPVFDSATTNSGVHKKENLNAAKRADESRCIQSEKHMVFRSAKGAENTLLQRTFEHAGYDTKSRNVIQIWMSDLPWWSETILEIDGEIESVAKLISVDGEKLSETIPHPWSAVIVDGTLGIETNIPLTVVEEASTNAIPVASDTTTSSTDE